MTPETTSSPVAHLTVHTPLMPAILTWEIFLKDQGRSPHTIKAFMGDLNLLASFLPPDKTLGSITTQDLNHFLQWLEKGRGVPCSPKSLARRITSIKAFFRWLQRSGVLLNDPALRVIQQSVISPLPEVLTPEEVDAVLEVARTWRTRSKPDARPYTLVKLLLETAIKKSECLAITRNHIDPEGKEGPVLYVRYASPSNRYKERNLPLSPEWIEAYQEYLAQYQPAEHIFPWSPRRLEYILEDLSEAAGISKHLSFDMCRWTSALMDWKNGVEGDQIRQKLGVSKIQWREISMKLRQLAEQGG
jgi:integrase/recombinase XerD